jgi:hypothetical protein
MRDRLTDRTTDWSTDRPIDNFDANFENVYWIIRNSRNKNMVFETTSHHGMSNFYCACTKQHGLKPVDIRCVLHMCKNHVFWRFENMDLAIFVDSSTFFMFCIDYNLFWCNYNSMWNVRNCDVHLERFLSIWKYTFQWNLESKWKSVFLYREKPRKILLVFILGICAIFMLCMQNSICFLNSNLLLI